MNTLRKYLNIVASLLCIAMGTVYFIDAVLTSRTIIHLSDGKKVVIFGEHHTHDTNLYEIEALQVDRLAFSFAELLKENKAVLIVEEPSERVLQTHSIPTDIKLLASYCTQSGLKFIKDVDFRKKYLENNKYMLSDQGQKDFNVLAQKIMEDAVDLKVYQSISTIVTQALDECNEYESVTDEALFSLFNAKLLTDIYRLNADVIGVIAGGMHTGAIIDEIAKNDFTAWRNRSVVGGNGQAEITPLSGDFLSFNPSIDEEDQQYSCIIL